MRQIQDIQKLRKKHNLTQKQLAEQSGVSQSLIAKIEAGKLDPTFTKAKQIFDALEQLKNKEELKAKDIMKTKVCSAQSKDTIKETIQLMKSKGISQMPVLDKDRIVGIISEGIILNEILKNPEKVSSLKVEDIMHDTPPIISMKTSITIISELLRDYPIVIVSERGDVKGIISKTDLLGKIE